MAYNNLTETVYRTCVEQHLLSAANGLKMTLVVGVSGGTDSLAVLHILARLRDRLSCVLQVATLDHGLRGAAGATDAQFVAETAQTWGLPVTVGQADVRALAQAQQIGIEAAARIARYDFLASVAAQSGATSIAVAHQADDQAETVLLHLLRGTGIAGLAGMAYAAPLPGHPDLTLIRPLLGVPRADLDAYCHENGLQPRHDASNDDVTYTRNRLRAEVIPHLRELAPQIERNLLQLAEIARVEDDYADFTLHQVIDSHIRRSLGRVTLPRARFMEMHPALQRRFVLWAAHSIADAADVGYVHVTAAVELAQKGQVGARAQLTNGMQLRLDYETIVIELDDTLISDDLPLVTEGAGISVVIPGLTPVSANWSLRVKLTASAIDEGRLAIREESKLILRGRSQGDRFAPLGLGGHFQKISKWMIDHKIPARLRDRVPLLVIDDQIAAIGWRGWMVSENFAVTPHSARVIYIQFHKKLGSG